jgi:hypothetical protein
MSKTRVMVLDAAFAASLMLTGMTQSRDGKYNCGAANRRKNIQGRLE